MAQKDYHSWSTDKLIREIKTLLERKDFGLVYKEKEEYVATQCEDFLPVLSEVKDKQIQNNKSDLQHIIIEGDNYHALSALCYTHKKRIDVIYIDPPFNTGNKSWMYNNDYVDKDDSFKHSKWLSFMCKRLQLAHRLLSSNGIIAVAIDDYEHHTLRLIMDEIFMEGNRLGTIVVVHNPRGRNDDSHFGTMHEYLLIYTKNKKLAKVKHFDFTIDDLKQFDKEDNISNYDEVSFMRAGNNSNRNERPRLFYPIFVDKNTEKLSTEEKKDTVEILPINSKGEEKTWRWGKDTFNKKCATELFVRKVRGGYSIFKKRRVSDMEGRKPRTVWSDSKYDASSNGTMILKNILGNNHGFPHPKSLYAVSDIIEIISHKNSTILDFFAGSGTTGHAVLELNKKDGGNRKFILCANNEFGKREEDKIKEGYNCTESQIKKEREDKSDLYKEWEEEFGICSNITYPRIKKVIEGYPFQGTDTTQLYSQEVKNYTSLKKLDLEEVENIREENKNRFDKVEIRFEKEILKVEGRNVIKDKKEGLGGNLRYYKTDFVDQVRTDADKRRLVVKSTEMLCLTENTFDKILEEKYFYAIFENSQRTTGIIYDEEAINDFNTAVKKLSKPLTVYVFSYAHAYNQEDFSDIKKLARIKPIPEVILNVYRKIYKNIRKPKRL